MLMSALAVNCTTVQAQLYASILLGVMSAYASLDMKGMVKRVEMAVKFHHPWKQVGYHWQ